MEFVAGVPWRRSEEDEKADGEAWRMDVPPPIAAKIESDDEEKWQEVVPRQFCMRKVDFDKHGYSSGCKGCRALLKGTTR